MATKGKRLAIIGGGASGLAAAIAAGELARQKGLPLEVTLLERDDRVGRTILATGNGRCNFSNFKLDVSEYRNAGFVREVLERLRQASMPCEELFGDDGRRDEREWPHAVVCDFFESCGLEWRAEDDGRLYPLANKASVVLDVLRAAARDLGVREACEQEVSSVDAPRAPGKPFTMRMADGVFERADALIVSCGGRAAASLALPDMPFTRMRPVLGPLACADKDKAFTKELDNIRVKCHALLLRWHEGEQAYVPVGNERGELMFRKYGVSGICVFNLSREAEPGDVLCVNFLGDISHDRARDYLELRLKDLARRYGSGVTYEVMLRGAVLPRVAEALLKRAGVAAGKLVEGGEDIALLAELLTRTRLEVSGIGDEGLCQVRRGGFDVAAFDPATLESRSVEGLYVTGEALDVDGPCGGYNLHWAWSSGLLAGASAVTRLFGTAR